jgi:hypothetical protein
MSGVQWSSSGTCYQKHCGMAAATLMSTMLGLSCSASKEAVHCCRFHQQQANGLL